MKHFCLSSIVSFVDNNVTVVDNKVLTKLEISTSTVNISIWDCVIESLPPRFTIHLDCEVDFSTNIGEIVLEIDVFVCWFPFF